MNQLEVTILGQSYKLACPDGGEDALRAAVALVDREMSAIRDAGKVKARERMAVLAALNIAYQTVQQPAAATASAAAPARASAAPDARDVDALVRRIDAVLADDGLLI